MNDISPDQATKIHDIESYKEVTGAKRFKRTKDEVERGLSPEEALQERLANVDKPKKTIKKSKGTITLVIKPSQDVDPDYFEHIPDGPIEVELDNHWYSWFDSKMTMPYEDDASHLLGDMLDLGIGEVIVRRQFPRDFE